MSDSIAAHPREAGNIGPWPQFAQLVCLAALLLAGPSAARAEKLVLGTTAVAEFTPAYVAAEQGFFARHGLDVAVQIVPNSSTLVPGLLSGSIQVGGPPAPVVLQAIGEGLPLVCFAAGSEARPDRPVGAVLTRPGVTIAAARDLEGKRLAVSGVNSIMQILLRRWLAERGVDAGRITVVEVPFSGMMDALKTSSVDAVLEVQPFVSRIIDAGAGTVALDYYRDIPSGTLSTAFCGTAAWAASHRTEIAGFRAALDDAATFIDQDPAAARAILARTLKLPPAAVASIPLSRFDTELTAEQINWWVSVLREQKLLDRAIAPADVIFR